MEPVCLKAQQLRTLEHDLLYLLMRSCHHPCCYHTTTTHHTTATHYTTVHHSTCHHHPLPP